MSKGRTSPSPALAMSGTMFGRVGGSVFVGLDLEVGRMGPVGREGQDADTGRHVGVEEAVMPVGGLIEGVALGQLEHRAGDPVALGVFGEFELAAPMQQQLV